MKTKTKINNKNSKCQKKKKSTKIKRTSQLHKHTDWTVCTRFNFSFFILFSSSLVHSCLLVLVFLPRKRSGFSAQSIVRNDWFAYVLLHLALFLSVLFFEFHFIPTEKNTPLQQPCLLVECAVCVSFQIHLPKYWFDTCRSRKKEHANAMRSIKVWAISLGVSLPLLLLLVLLFHSS